MDDQDALERRIRSEWEPLRSSYERWGADNGETSGFFDELVDGQVRAELIRFQVERANADLQDHAIPWEPLELDDISEFQKLLEIDPDESSVHRFLQERDKSLVSVIGGGTFRCQISKQRLGAELVPDFLIASQDSMGIHWLAVELESPRVVLHRKDGQPRSQVHHAIAQIHDWRSWLRNNLDYARRSKSDRGLGLVGIDDRVAGLILIGRRLPNGREFPIEFNEFRMNLLDRDRIAIHSYDWLAHEMDKGNGWHLSSELSLSSS